MKLTHEMIETARVAKSAEELLLFAKEHGIDMTADEAKTYFEQINSHELDDDLLDGVSGGWLIYRDEALGPSDEEDKQSSSKGQCG